MIEYIFAIKMAKCRDIQQWPKSLIIFSVSKKQTNFRISFKHPHWPSSKHHYGFYTCKMIWVISAASYQVWEELCHKHPLQRRSLVDWCSETHPQWYGLPHLYPHPANREKKLLNAYCKLAKTSHFNHWSACGRATKGAGKFCESFWLWRLKVFNVNQNP